MTGIHPITRQRARKLRAEMTPQERRVWVKLRELNRMLGLHFRRQAPIGPFIVDFADLGRRLVIEVDGGGHGGERDAARDDWLSTQGFQVLRFWNPQISGNIEGVMQMIFDAVGGESLADAPPPHPSPTRGEGGEKLRSDAMAVGGVPPAPNPSPRGGGEARGAVVAQNVGCSAPPSPRVGEGWGGGASAKGVAPKGIAS
ncbi:MAG: endonuclease domain-containing protein [Rhodobacter sp.]|nr:endonuclease domain-containing protein [Rhodobacter sp.]